MRCPGWQPAFLPADGWKWSDLEAVFPGDEEAACDVGRAFGRLSKAMSQVVLITGASTGFGRATVELLARDGYRVFASMRDSVGRNATHRHALESLASKEKVSIEVVDLDVCNDASVLAATEHVLERAGRIDVVINNAGVAALGITEAYTLEKIKGLFEVNFFGVARVNRAVLPTMRRQRSGLLIHVSSAAGRAVAPYCGIYSASKFALEALADSYRFELAPFGVDSVIVEPGIHRTPILDAFQSPDDETRAADYGADGDFTSRVIEVFDAAKDSSETPGPTEVAEALLRLIAMPAGTRPFRTVPTPAMAPLLGPYNDAAEQIRQTVAQAFNLRELTVLKLSNE
jgi:NAD(P)-dependent dehydrogenase (short-subunit alcohol dehydrogenase family)